MIARINGFAICLLIFIVISGCENNPTDDNDNRKSHAKFMQEIDNEIRLDSLKQTVNELSGEIPILLNGNQHYIYTRYRTSPSNKVAAEYLQNRLENFDLFVELFAFDSLGCNVLAHQQGRRSISANNSKNIGRFL